MQKANVGHIIADHLATFADDAARWRGHLWFSLPLIVTAALLALACPLNPDAGKAIVYLSLALMLALSNGLFHLLRISASPSTRGSHAERRASILKAAHANLSFALLAAVATATATILYLLVAPAGTASRIGSFAIYLLASALGAALLAYLYRLHRLIDAELKLE